MTRTGRGRKFLRSSGWAWGLLSSALVLIGLACSSEGYGPGSDGDGIEDPSVGTACEGMSERACGLTLEVDDEKMTCYRGTQSCEDGVWSICRDGQVTRESLPSIGFDPTKRRVFADPSISDPSQCGNGQPTGVGGAGTGGTGSGGGPRAADFGNPCDPGCMHFDENPVDINANGGSSAGPLPVFPPRTCGTDGLCIAQGVVDPTCDPCAAKIIMKYPSCGTAWTQQCVFWATTECAGVTPPTNACDFGLLSDGFIDLRNKGATNATIGSYGNITIEAGSSFGSIYSLGNVQIQNLNAPIVLNSGGGIFSNGSITIATPSGTGTIQGNLYARTTVEMNSLKMTGEVWAGAASTNAINGQSGALVTGSARANGTINANVVVSPAANKVPNAGFTPIVVNLPPKAGGTVVPILPTTCPTGGTNYINQGTPRTLTPGTYGQIGMQNGQDLILQGQGIYRFQALQLAGNSKLVLDLSGQTYTTGWDVRVCDKFATDPASQTLMFGNRVRVAGQGMGWPAGLPNDANGVLKDPKYLTLFYAGPTTVIMETDVYWTGIFMAPNALVQKSPMNAPAPAPLLALPTNMEITNGTRAAPVNGAIWAKEIRLEPGALTRPISSADCNAIPHLPIVSPPECPLESGARGLRNEPCSSGQDCQANSHCFRPETGASCSHSKCVTGAALTSTCDDCVARICAVDANCCSSTWNQACVNRVATVCDAVCQQGDCTQDPCVAGGPIEKACEDNIGGECIKKVCDAIPSCCTTAWTAACVTELMKPTVCGSISSQTRLCDYAAYAKEDYVLEAGSTVSGTTGTATTVADPDPLFPNLGAGFFNCQAGTVSHAPGLPDLDLNPAIHYDRVHVGEGYDLSFETPGTYYMNELTTDGGNTFYLPPAPGIVNIVVCGKVWIGEDSNFVGMTTGADSLRLRIYSNYNGDDAIRLVRPLTPTTDPAYPDARTRYGALIAPYGEVRIGQNIIHHGLAWGEDVRLVSPAQLTYASATKTACENYPLDNGPVPGGGVCALDLVPVPATETAKCVENAAGYDDSSCTGYDLALGIPCMTGPTLGIPVCNHGTGPFPPSGSASVTIGRYAENLGQLAIDEPTVPPSGTFNQSFNSATNSIPAGTCTTVNWGTSAVPFPAGRFTLMLDPSNPAPKVLNECNNRRLDNWSATDGRACIPFGQPKTVEYEYEAECPDGATARWGLLTWNTTTPGDSKIIFSLKSGADDAELAAAAYEEVGVAQFSPDTQLCVFQDTTPCYVDITGELSLGSTQGQKLSLKVDLLPGTGSPVLRDWGISYSCIYDE